MSARSLQILSRFPSHLEPTRPGKQLRSVADALVVGLDTLADRMAGVRRAHRVGHADELRDVLLLAGLNGIGSRSLSVLFARNEAVAALLAKLENALDGPPADLESAANAVFDLFGVEGAARLELFAPAHDASAAADPGAAARALSSRVRSMIGYRGTLEAARTCVVRICRLHREGNGTVRAILSAAANALNLEIDAARNAAVKDTLVKRGAPTFSLAITDEFFHSTDLFWHSTFLRDRAPLMRTVPTTTPAKLVRMNETIAFAELADQMTLRAAEVAARLAESGLPALELTAIVDLPTAEKITAIYGYEVERYPRGVTTMGATITVAELARGIGVAAPAIVARLAARGIASAGRDTALTPEVAVVIARKFGFRLDQRLGPESEILGIEENPLRRETYRKEDCFHGDLFQVIRRGFGRELLRAEITGVENHTWGPMIVNRDEGRGIGFFGNVPAGKKLVFTEDGKATLDGVDVTAFAYSWRGACFADATARTDHDFKFDAPNTVFAVAAPDGALDAEFDFPHAAQTLEVPGVNVGVTNMAFFIQEMRLSSREGTADAPVIHRVTPHYAIGFLDGAALAPEPGQPYPTSADVVLSWMEHEAYALRVIIPPRFKSLDTAAASIADRLTLALERFRPAGVSLRVEYRDDRWVLGRGDVVAGDTDDPNLMLRGGTVLAAPGTPGNN